jgi:anaerobic selenocysteine-containing dehydrogenase
MEAMMAELRSSPRSPQLTPGSATPVTASLMITCLGDALFPRVGAVHNKDSPVNELTNAAFDPVAKTAEFKVCAVRIEREPEGIAPAV